MEASYILMTTYMFGYSFVFMVHCTQTLHIGLVIQQEVGANTRASLHAHVEGPEQAGSIWGSLHHLEHVMAQRNSWEEGLCMRSSGNLKELYKSSVNTLVTRMLEEHQKP